MMAGKSRKIIAAVMGLAVCILAIAGLILYGNLLAFLMVFPWIADRLVTAGLDVWLARLITVPLAFVLVMSLGLALSFSRVKRNAGLALFALGIMLWSLAMHRMSGDYAFDPVSGKAQKCFAQTPEGYEAVSCAWKVHPLYGTAVVAATKEMMTARWVEQNGVPTMHSVDPDQSLRFFTPDGTALIWYYRHPDGKLDLFAQPGRHPQFNVALKPVDADVVRQILEDADKDKSRVHIDMHEKEKGAAPEEKVRLESLRELKKTLQETKTRRGL